MISDAIKQGFGTRPAPQSACGHRQVKAADMQKPFYPVSATHLTRSSGHVHLDKVAALIKRESQGRRPCVRVQSIGICEGNRLGTQA